MKHLSILALCVVASAATPASAAGPTVPELYEQSYGQEALRDYAGALATLQQLPTRQQQTYVFSLRKAWLLYLSARYAEAAPVYKHAIQLAPKAVEPRLGLSLAQMGLRSWLDAEKTLTGVLELDPKSYLGLSRLAWTRYSLGRFGPAEATYRQVLELYPADIEMQAGLGWALVKQGKTAEAKSAFEAVLEVAPRHTASQDGLRALATQ